MTIRYPGGKKYQPPTPKNNTSKKDYSFSNRGKTLEDEVNESNDYYLQHQLAVVHKKPIPIQIVKVDYPGRSRAVIREAYYRTPSTTDYNGVYKGYYLDFEAKETKNKTSFPLQNVHEHQVLHMRSVRQQQGIAFLLVAFQNLERYFFLSSEQLDIFWERMQQGGRKSITLEEFEQVGIEITPGYAPRIPYLNAVDHYVIGNESEDGARGE
ncbi:Holliday junction resolvase RecU [Chryseomicrobium excrementi]|uniref:Holliday junction resolvase RecU n=1 Tax=Chryseomicrobium excrementi TaxID=2041346 RepID=A0A2M9F2P7_9BACL|nr:Holliday junction resolvase RecU [Chryseomicrobium excrementi]PJK17740.1 Holliday junction resolvase RecU [Chryseomicrobium excrementi]